MVRLLVLKWTGPKALLSGADTFLEAKEAIGTRPEHERLLSKA